MYASVLDVDLKLLRVFVTIVESGGFSAAQSELSLSQSAISTQMSDLEIRLGMRLCQRGRAGFALTANGQAVFEAAQRLLSAIGVFRADIGQLRGRLAGELTVAVVDATLTNPAWRLPQTIRAFLEKSENLKVQLKVASPQEINKGLLDGRIQVGIGVFYRHVPGLNYEFMLNERQGLYCGALHPLFTARPVRLQDIEKASYIGRRYLPDAEMSKFPVQFRNDTVAENMEAIASLILTGRFMSHLPTHFADRWVKSGDMAELLPDQLSSNIALETVIRADQRQSMIVDAFMTELRQRHPLTASSTKP